MYMTNYRTPRRAPLFNTSPPPGRRRAPSWSKSTASHSRGRHGPETQRRLLDPPTARRGHAPESSPSFLLLRLSPELGDDQVVAKVGVLRGGQHIVAVSWGCPLEAGGEEDIVCSEHVPACRLDHRPVLEQILVPCSLPAVGIPRIAPEQVVHEIPARLLANPAHIFLPPPLVLDAVPRPVRVVIPPQTIDRANQDVATLLERRKLLPDLGPQLLQLAGAKPLKDLIKADIHQVDCGVLRQNDLTAHCGPPMDILHAHLAVEKLNELYTLDGESAEDGETGHGTAAHLP